MNNDTVASAFLRNYRKMQEPVLPSPAFESTDVSNDLPQNVILSRPQEPRYYAGAMRGSGRAIWSNDIRHALPVAEDMVHLYEQKLGTVLLPLWPYAR